MLTFLHVSWVEENACRAKSTSVGEKSDRTGDVQAVTVISTDTKRAARFLKVGWECLMRFMSFVNFQGIWKHANAWWTQGRFHTVHLKRINEPTWPLGGALNPNSRQSCLFLNINNSKQLLILPTFIHFIIHSSAYFCFDAFLKSYLWGRILQLFPPESAWRPSVAARWELCWLQLSWWWILCRTFSQNY